jgi:L,D-transpeptidase YcbB
MSKRAVLVLLFVATASCNRTDRAVGHRIRDVVSSPKPPANLAGGRWKLLQQVYRDREYRPLWLERGKPTRETAKLVATLCGAERDGLRPSDYHLADLKHMVERVFDGAKKPDPAALAALDLELTSRFVDYGTDLLVGRLAPAAVDSGWFIKARRSSSDSMIRVAARGGNFARMVAPLRPGRGDYNRLAAALARYRQIKEQGGWPKVAGGKGLVRGARGAGVVALRERLRISGDLRGSSGAGSVYNAEVAAAVARFQKRHGIPVDSATGRATLVALNTPVEYWIRQIEINLERLRWLPPDFGNRYIVVNIPDYHLFAFEGGKATLDMRVIVGEEYGNATPVFADSMSYIVFRPHWYVPRTILVNEVIPQVRQNPYYLAQHALQVVDVRRSTVLDPAAMDWSDVDTTKMEFRVRQKAGKDNPLGLIKFMFPNQFSVYLHDTPAAWLFRQPRRALSHGCVRVERPVELAEFVLDGQDGWDEAKIRNAMQSRDSISDRNGIARDSSSGEGQTVRLEHPVPVFILYLTAYMADGVLNFRGDPYGKDGQALARLGGIRPRDHRVCGELIKLLGG